MPKLPKKPATRSPPAKPVVFSNAPVTLERFKQIAEEEKAIMRKPTAAEVEDLRNSRRLKQTYRENNLDSNRVFTIVYQDDPDLDPDLNPDHPIKGRAAYEAELRQVAQDAKQERLRVLRESRVSSKTSTTGATEMATKTATTVTKSTKGTKGLQAAKAGKANTAPKSKPMPNGESVHSDVPVREPKWTARRIAVVKAMRALGAVMDPSTAVTAEAIGKKAGKVEGVDLKERVDMIKIILDVYRTSELVHNGFAASHRKEGERSLCYYLTKKGVNTTFPQAE